MRVRCLQITDRASVGQAQILQRIRQGSSRVAVQLRDPEMPTDALAELGRALRDATRAVGATFFVNDRLDLARWLGADGVHLGRRSVSVDDARSFCGDVLVSCSAHSPDEAVARAREGADLVLLSPIWSTPGKGEPLGLGALGAAREAMPPEVALFALGGVNANNAEETLAAGADGLAAIRADLTMIALSPLR